MFLDKKILLHIGYPKSLSTTLQEDIFPNISKIKNIDFINKKRTQNKYCNRNFNREILISIIYF